MTEKRDIGMAGDKLFNTPELAPEKKFALASAGALVSILVPCCGMIEYTKLCVPSILKFTRHPYELIFLDIGSLDGTVHYLSGIKAASAIRVEVLRIADDLDIANTCKEAISLARGEYLVLLNNDTVVTHGWLNQLVSLASTSPGFGMAGPMSNYAEPPQLVESVTYRIKPKRPRSSARNGVGEPLLELEAMHAFARAFREQNGNKWMRAERLGGFCLLLKREVLDRVGLANLDQSELSLFDTDALCAKVRQAGYNLVCCRDLFIHHFGTRTFSQGAPGQGTA